MSGIVVVGSLNADLVATVKRAPSGGETVAGSAFRVFPGGKGANQAVAVGKLGGSVRMLGCVGSDPYAERLRASLREAGVDSTGIRCIEEVSTGVALITVEDGGENRIVVVPGANGRYSAEAIAEDFRSLGDFEFALFQLETPLDAVAVGLRLAKRRGGRTILDPAPAQDLPDSVLRHVDYLTPNASELALLTGGTVTNGGDMTQIVERARSLLGRGVGKVAVKLGEAGAALVSSVDVYRVYGYKVDVVDTTAAGDCFNGAFVVGLLRGMSDREALEFACAASALSVTQPGAQSSLPTLEQVERFRAEGKAKYG